MEGIHANLLAYLSTLPGMSATGTTLTLVSSNSNIDNSGNITYGATQLSGTVQVKINKANDVEQYIEIPVTVPATTSKYTLSIGSESNGGRGKIRTLTIGGVQASELEGRTITVQISQGTGENLEVTILNFTATPTVTISYASAESTMIKAWLSNGIPNLIGGDMEVKVDAYAFTH